ncbi:MAG: hypothetical protein GEU90_06360 [Gemmatimonas sp.]|nr:hypothetical protein [Gemmatimonas sp.]
MELLRRSATARGHDSGVRRPGPRRRLRSGPLPPGLADARPISRKRGGRVSNRRRLRRPYLPADRQTRRRGAPSERERDSMTTGQASGTATTASRRSLREVAFDSLKGLFAVGDVTCDCAARAVHGLLFSEPVPAEYAWAGTIERLRADLESSSEAVSIALPYAGAKERFSTVGEICRRRSKGRIWGLLLHRLVRGFAPSTALELGTCLGVSTSYQAAAMKLNGRGRLISLEGAAALADQARKNLRKLCLDCVEVRTGLFQHTLEPALRDLGSIDFAFIDGHHDEEATLAYFEMVVPFLAHRAILVFDDIAWSDGMRRAWARLRADPRVRVTLDLSIIGICILGRDLPKQDFDFPSLSRVQAAQVVPHIRRAVRGRLPVDAPVLVVSRGDDELLELVSRRAQHFPQTNDGAYAGHHPGDSRDAIDHLERLREGGAEYLVFPSTAFWWFEFYSDFRRHLELHSLSVHQDEDCAIFQLSGAR